MTASRVFARRNALFGLAGLVLLCAPVMLAQDRKSSSTPEDSGQFVRGRILVKFKDSISTEQAHGALAGQQGHCIGEIPSIGVHVVELPFGSIETVHANSFRHRADVEFAELDQILTPQAVTPNDPYYPMEYWPGWIQISDAWSVTTGSNSIVVAVIDSGVNSGHSDLSAKIVPGWNFFDNNSNTFDVTGHGTWAAGVIAASSNNGFGVAGVCWGCKLMPLRVSDTSGNAAVSTIANAIIYAADHGAKIANVGYAITSAGSTINTALLYQFTSGGITVAPSGNNGTFDSSSDNVYILTVGGTTYYDDTIWVASNTGNNIDLTAPNFTGYTTLNNAGYGPDNSGTCISAAIVSGVAALVWSANPNLTPADVTGTLQQSADDKGPAGWDSTYGWGRVNALRAVNMATGVNKTNTTTTLASGLNPSILGQIVTFTATVSPVLATGLVTFRDGSTTLGTGLLAAGVATFSTSSLSGGSHSMTAIYGGDTNYNTSVSAAVTQTVKSSSTTAIVSSLNPSTSGQLVTFTATVVPAAATGTVTFFDGGAPLGTSTISGGTATLSTSSLSVASHSIQGSYSGDVTYNGSISPPLTQVVNTSTKTNTTTSLTSSVNPSTFGQAVTFTATVSPATATGTVTFFDGATNLGTGALSSGVATFAISSLSVGAHSITASYGGNSSFNGSTSPAVSQTVNKANSTTGLTSGVNPSSFAQSVTFTATVSPASATGTVTFKDGATTLGTGTLSGGVATFATTSLSVGNHSITATYGGDGSFNSSASGAVTQTVNKANTTTGLTSSVNPSNSGQSVTFTATVSPGTATGVVTFLDGTTTLGTGALSGGVATFTTSSLSTGSHSITVSYGGDSNFNSSVSGAVSQSVGKANTTTSLTSSVNPSTFGQAVTFTATVSPATATGTVTFFDGATNLGTGTLSSGVATFAISSLSVGAHSITASYGGNSSFNGSTSAAVSQTVIKLNTSTIIGSSLNPTLFGQAVTFTATVSPAAATGTVTFLDGGTTLGTATLSGGVATFTTSGLAVGTHSITANYGGNATYNGSLSTTLSQTVNAASGKVNTTTSLSSSLNPSQSGQSVTFTATISPATATGFVSFFDNGSNLGTGTVSGGIATVTSSSLTVGSHSIQASYGGDANSNGSISPVLTQTVNIATKTNTTTGISSSPNPSISGNAVTFTAVVSPSGATGLITFLDGASTLGSATLIGGTATYVTSSLAVGSHSITASYGGDSNFNSSASAALIQVVNTAADTTPPSAPTNLAGSASDSVHVNLTWTASTDNVGVAGYRVFRDAVQIGTSPTPGYIDNTVTAGATYSYNVFAYDAANNLSVTSNTAVVAVPVSSPPPDTAAPTVTITSPRNNTKLKAGAVVSVRVSATDNVGVVRVELYVDGVVRATSTVAPFTTTWTDPGGSHTLQAKAYDAAGNVGVSSSIGVR